jgi:hypothetical protein
MNRVENQTHLYFLDRSLSRSLALLLCLGLTNVIFASEADSQWIQARPFEGGNVVSFASIGQIIVADNAEGIFASSDDGVTWNTADTLIPSLGAGFWTQLSQTISCLNSSGTTLFAAADGGETPGDPYGLYISSDSGASWAVQNLRIGQGTYSDWEVSSLYVSSPVVFAAMLNGYIFRSADNGAVFRESDAGLVDASDNALYTITALGGIGSTVVAGAYASGVFRSTNSGTSWVAADSNFGEDVSDLPSPDAFLTLQGNLFAATDQGMFLTTDRGISWAAIDSGLPPVSILSLAGNGTSIFAGTDGAGIYLTTNQGVSWAAVDSGLTDVSFTALISNGTYLFAGTASDGIWKRPIVEMVTGVRAVHSSIPVKFSLSQNYPNPFNPITTIKYEIPTSSTVHLAVFDLLGRRVATLADGLKHAGVYSVSFNGTNLASGVYYCRLQAGTYTSVKKLLLAK